MITHGLLLNIRFIRRRCTDGLQLGSAQCEGQIDGLPLKYDSTAYTRDSTTFSSKYSSRYGMQKGENLAFFVSQRVRVSISLKMIR